MAHTFPNEARTGVLPRFCLDRIDDLLARHPRVLLGLTGTPGSGKSTLARLLCEAYPDLSQVVPMDGYHLANAELQRLGRAGRKGAPDTFDGAGYVALLRRIRRPAAGETVYAPEFHREIEEAIAGALPIHPETRLLVTEGIYLLLDSDPWRAIPPLLDEIWYLEIDEDQRLERLVRRHEHHGRSPKAARDWVRDTDEPNARLIEAMRPRADWIVDWEQGKAIAPER